MKIVFKENLEDEVDYENIQEEDYENPKKWFDEIEPDAKEFSRVSDQVFIELKEEAKKCLDSESASYKIKVEKTNKDYRWMKTVMAKGTLSDKIAAYTVQIQNKPVFNLENIRYLIGMVKVGKKHDCITIMDTLTELFLSDLLRPEKTLRSFQDRPLSLLNDLSSGNTKTRRKYLMYWYFEDQLREIYTSFVLALNAAAHDTIDKNKEKAIAAMTQLLAGNPEQEKNLLSHIVNKMGDPSQRVASKTMYCLSQLLAKHTRMQGVVLAEVEKLLFRSNVGVRPQYYSLCFLSQFYLNNEDTNIPRKLIDLYFSFFKKSIKQGEVDSRMMSVLLIGVNRAFPYSKLHMKDISEHIDTMYRIVHAATFNISLNALALLFQISHCSTSLNDRFYSALFKKLMDPRLITATNQAILLNLIFKAMIKDPQRDRLLTFVKRLLQICLNVQPNMACGVLLLISTVMSKKSNLYLLDMKGQIEKDSVASMLDDDDDDEEEKYFDVKDDIEIIKETGVEDNDDKNDIKAVETNGKSVASWYRCNAKKTKTNVRSSAYDPLARNPLYANANQSCYAELKELKNHYHPSVALFAENILKRERIYYTGDPLKDFTVIRFIDRFVYKNPKQISESVMKLDRTFTKRRFYQPKGTKSIPVFSNEYLKLDAKNVPVDELFMHNFLQTRYKNKQITKNNEDDDDASDADSVASDEFEDMLNNMHGFKDMDDEEIDFMNDVDETIQQQKSKPKKKGKKDDLEEEGDDDEDDDQDEDEDDEESEDDNKENASDEEEMSDGELKMDDDDEDIFKDLDDDDDMSDMVFDSDEDEKDLNIMKKGKKKKNSIKDYDSPFVAAEEFASLLEDESNVSKKAGTSNQYKNTDEAAVKQLDWEENRNRFVKGFNNKSDRGFNKFGKKRPFKSNFKGKTKKQKQF